MRAADESSDDEIGRLRGCLNALLGIVALPAVWAGSEPAQIAASLLETLGALLPVDFVYVRSSDADGRAIELGRVAGRLVAAAEARSLGDALDRALGSEPPTWPLSATVRFDGDDLEVTHALLGLGAALGVVVAGSRQPGCFGQSARLVMNVAANQAAISLQAARALGEQRRLARDLDRRVEQRTAELATANDELKLEISERQRIEAALRESEQSARSIVDGIPGLVALMTPVGQIEFVNQQVVEYCGRPHDELGAWATDGTVHPEDAGRVAEILGHAFASGTPYDVEERIRRFDGVYRWFQVRGRPILHSSGHIVRWCVLLIDIDERKRTEEALRRSEAELTHASRVMSLGVLTASIVHEVSQPLSAILTNSNTCQRMLASAPPNLGGAREIVRRMTRDGVRASEVLTRLRSMFGRKERSTEAVDLNEAAREVVALSASRLQRAGVFVRLELAGGLPAVMGDRVQLQQVILNLIGNAHDAMTAVEHRPRQLLIRTTLAEGDRVELAVQDTGAGLDPRVADTLFDAFSTTKNDGMGIGLSVSRTIVEEHRGRLWVTPNDGHGVTFRFTIPSEGFSPLRGEPQRASLVARSAGG